MEQNQMKVSKIAKNQWKQIIGKPCRNDEEVEYKIRRAFYLGKKSYNFINNANTQSYIKRYYDLNIMVTNNVIELIFRYKGTPMVMIPHVKKIRYDRKNGYIPPTPQELEVLKKEIEEKK